MSSDFEPLFLGANMSKRPCKICKGFTAIPFHVVREEWVEALTQSSGIQVKVGDRICNSHFAPTKSRRFSVGNPPEILREFSTPYYTKPSTRKIRSQIVQEEEIGNELSRENFAKRYSFYQPFGAWFLTHIV